MGVIPCDRTGCSSIMCDRYSYTHGRLCYMCFEELVQLGPDTNIEDFMCSSMSDTKDEESSYDFFDREFPER